MPITTEKFGQTSTGQPVVQYTLTNTNGMVVKVITLGGIISSLQVPGRDGKVDDVVLGFDTVEGYEKDPMYIGPIVGRCANRIDKGKFDLDGEEIQLSLNDGGVNHLHGGTHGMSKDVWSATLDGNIIKFNHTSPDKDDGYPGVLDTTVTYQLTDDNKLMICYTATTTKPTPVNLSNHAYFNLAGHNSGTIYDHKIQIDAETYTPKNKDEPIVTGEIAPVSGTIYDLREPVVLGECIHDVEGGGYDHNFCLSQPSLTKLSIRVQHPKTGRTMEVFTTMPGVQFYTANFLDGKQVGKNEACYPKHGAFCLETQYYPDSVNHKNFPNVILRPGETYQHKTVYKFSW